MHPVQEGLFEDVDSFAGLDDGLADLWDPGSMLLLRWRESAAGAPGSDVVIPVEWENQLLAAAAEALQVEESKLTTQVLFPEHRLLVFKHNGPNAENSGRLPAQLHWNAWKTAMLAPEGKLGAIADSAFPPALNVTLCLHTHALEEMETAKKEKEAGGQEGAASSAAEGSEAAGEDAGKSADVKLPDDFISIVGPSADAHSAYMAGCDWWTTRWMHVVGEAGHFDDEDVHDFGGHPLPEGDVEVEEGDDLA